MIDTLFDTSGFVPRWQCGAWSPALGWLHIVSDLMIWLAYLAIPCVLIYVVRRRELPFPKLFWLFGAFIFSCGTTHLIDAILFYEPIYRFAGVVKWLTAVASWATVIALIAAIPKLLSLRGQGDFEREVAARTAELQATNAALHRSEQSLREAQRIAGLGSWEWDPVRDDPHWSEEMFRIFGLDPAKPALNYKEVQALYPPREWNRLSTAVERALTQGTPYELELEIARADGAARWVVCRGETVHGATGGVAGLRGTIQDVTDHLSATRQFERQRAELQLILDTVPALIFYKDRDHRLLRVNRELERVVGVPKEKLVGRTDAELGSPHAAEYARDEDEIVATGVAKRGVIEELHTSAGTRWLQTDKLPYRDATGEIVGIIGMAIDVTERLRAEAALREKELLLRSADRRLAELVEGMSEACFTLDMDWRFTFVNDSGETLLRHRRGELIGWPIWDVFHQLVGTAMEGHYRRAMTERVPISFVTFSPVAQRWLDIRLFPTPGGLAAFLLDIHERKLAEDNLHRSEAKAGAVLSALSEGVVFVNPRGEVDMANDAVRRILGRGVEELANRDPREGLLRSDGSEFPVEEQPTMMALRTGRGVRDVEMGVPNADGAIRWLTVNAEVVREPSGEIRGAVASFFDITERKLAEARVRELNADLENRVRERTIQLEEANKELESFSYSVSHDLRGPLRSVNGFSKILLEDYGEALPAEAREHLADIRAGAVQMGRLIDDLLAFSRLGRKAIVNQVVDTVELAIECWDEFAALREGRAVEFHLGALSNCRADRSLLKQVFVNLLSNALKYTSKKARAIVEFGSVDGSYFVRDNGVGFDMRYADKLFAVFQRLHRSEDYEGTGVGLAIVQRIIARHGGRVWAEAEPDVGATFFFTLPQGDDRHER